MTSFISREAVADCAFIVRHDGGCELRPSVEMKTVLEQAADYADRFVNARWMIVPVLDCNGRLIVLDIDHYNKRVKNGRKRARKPCEGSLPKREQRSIETGLLGEATQARLDELSAFYERMELEGNECSPFDERWAELNYTGKRWHEW